LVRAIGHRRWLLASVKQHLGRETFISSTSNPQAIPDQDDEMLAEYDFSKGVRGKHRDRNLAPKLPGVQFLKNTRKTAVLLDLGVHEKLWQQVIDNGFDSSEFQYLMDAENHTRSVFLDFKTHLEIWQVIYDRIIA
jgi:hypothetical protein